MTDLAAESDERRADRPSGVSAMIVGAALFAAGLATGLALAGGTVAGARAAGEPMPEEAVEEGQGFGPRGLFRCQDQCLYSAFEFRSEDTVVIHGFGISVPAKYRMETTRQAGTVDQWFYIETAQGELALRTGPFGNLIGEGFASGTFVLDEGG